MAPALLPKSILKKRPTKSAITSIRQIQQDEIEEVSAEEEFDVKDQDVNMNNEESSSEDEEEDSDEEDSYDDSDEEDEDEILGMGERPTKSAFFFCFFLSPCCSLLLLLPITKPYLITFT